MIVIWRSLQGFFCNHKVFVHASLEFILVQRKEKSICLPFCTKTGNHVAAPPDSSFTKSYGWVGKKPLQSWENFFVSPAITLEQEVHAMKPNENDRTHPGLAGSIGTSPASSRHYNHCIFAFVSCRNHEGETPPEVPPIMSLHRAAYINWNKKSKSFL